MELFLVPLRKKNAKQMKRNENSIAIQMGKIVVPYY